MVSANFISVEVAYATLNEQKIISLKVLENTTLEEVIKRSSILTLYPEIDLTKQKIGIFGKKMKLTDKVQESDRVEIYRSLIIDPKESRRKRAISK